MYEFTSLFLYKFQFLIEIFAAESLFLWHLKKRKGFAWKAPLFALCSFALVFAIPIVSYDFWYQTIMFLLIFLITIASATLCFEESFLNIIFCCIAGYSTQHIAFSIYQCFMVATFLDGGNSLNMYGDQLVSSGVYSFLSFYIYMTIYILSYLSIYFIFGRKIKKEQDFYVTNNSLFIVAIFMVFLAVFLNSVMVDHCNVVYDRIPLLISFVYGILSCSLVLALQFKLKDVKEKAKELQIVEQLWKEDKAHYELAKENIDLINIKCHDLKHQIAAFRRTGVVDENAWDEVENSVMIYGSIIKTGNDALDVVLTEKSLIANRDHISLTYIADGSKIAFMKQSDIYSLFGNAIENAIEYLSTQEENKRFIRLHVKGVQDMVSIHIENYFRGELKYQNGLPLTTKKEDRGYHGYGTLSMKRLVESYGGVFFIKAQDELYCVDILIPIPQDQE